MRFRRRKSRAAETQSWIVLARVLIASCAALGTAHACPVVTLEGDPELVEQVRTHLVARGVPTTAEGTCPRPPVARVERGEPLIVVTVDDVTREVLEASTAATVIEAFASDPGAPLLAARPVAAAPVAPAEVAAPAVAVAAQPRSAARGLYVFAGMDSAVASDREGWLGIQAGLCVMVGPVCLAGRYRNAVGVTDGDQTQSQNQEALLGVDVPFALGPGSAWWLIPGVALGKSFLQVRTPESYLSSDVVRAEVHATLSVPLSPRFGLDVSLAGSIVQRVHDDFRMGDTPSEAWGLARLGVALRYGAR